MKAKKRVTACLILTVLLASVLSPAGNKGMAAQDGKEAVQWLYSRGSLTNEFDTERVLAHPEQVITREEFISLLMVMAGRKENAPKGGLLSYEDGAAITPSLLGYMAAADRQAVLRSVTVKKKRYIYPGAKLTRQMAAFYLARVTGLHRDLELEEITDYGKGSPNLIPYITAVVSADLIAAEPSAYRPLARLSWGEAAQIVKRVWEAGYFNPSSMETVAGGASADKPETGFLDAADIAAGEDGTIYVADTGNNQIKAVKDGTVTVLAGKSSGNLPYGDTGGYRDGKAGEALFSQPSGICYIEGRLLIADTGNHSLRLLDLEKNEVTTFAGTGKEGSADGNRRTAAFCEPRGLAVAEDGTVYVADTGNSCIRKIDAAGTVTTAAGRPGQEGFSDGPAGEALFNRPMDIIETAGVLYVADTGNQRIRRIENGAVTTEAGSGTAVYEGTADIEGGYQDGSAGRARFDGPAGLAAGEDGALYIADRINGMVRKLTGGRVSTLAGFGSINQTDPFALSTLTPSGIFVSEKDRKLYVMDAFTGKIVRLNTVR